jgi:hypothetical protein
MKLILKKKESGTSKRKRNVCEEIENAVYQNSPKQSN